METVKKLKTPLNDEQIRSLQAGDQVAITGTIYSARDMAHKRICDTLQKGEKLPFELAGAVIYYLGPTPARPGKAIGAAGPTTSSRMDAFSPMLYDTGLKATIGKGYREAEVCDSLKKNTAVHLAAIGGAGALLSEYIIASEVIAYEDLGPEAIRALQVKDFPAVVAYDANGGSVYNR